MAPDSGSKPCHEKIPLKIRPSEAGSPVATARLLAMNPNGPPPPIPPRPPGFGIWQPPVGATWNYVLHHPVRLDHTIEQHDVWIIDLL